MSAGEQRVRTMAGWIGVEISKSRVRKPGRVGYGLYRVRGTKVVTVSRDPVLLEAEGAVVPASEWTAYAFTLADIETAVRNAIGQGRPVGPLDLYLPFAAALRPGSLDPVTLKPTPTGAIVPTRWDAAYRGRRDLGIGQPSVGAPLIRSTIRSRQRAMSREFGEAHRERRVYGKARYHAMKLRRNAAGDN